MERRRIALALAVVMPAVANAQVSKFVPIVVPGTLGLPPAPVTGPAMTLSPNLSVLPTVSGKSVLANPTVASPLAINPILVPKRLPPVNPLAVSGAAKAEAPANGVTMQARLQNLASSVAPKPGVVAKDADVSLQKFWSQGAIAAAEPDFRMFGGGNLDPRIGTALQTMGRSAVGLSIYREIYNKYGGSLQLRVDNDPSATYDARTTFEGPNPVITVTDNLLRRESAEFASSYIAREMAHLYYSAFPASVERDYLANSAMVRTYAELTSSNNRWWDTRRDRWQDGRYSMQSFFKSWREASVDYYARGRNIQESPFFRYLQGGSNRTLEQLYYDGRIDAGTYRQMSDYFRQMARSEYDWLRGNEGR
ncbi:MAG: hypothetical protein HY925_05105 [Elusimicrobia bacterium]|nr:hypothetical protein [Elusimicrobiota bacterium]